MNKLIKTIAVGLSTAFLFSCNGAGQPMSGNAAIVIAKEGVSATEKLNNNKETLRTGTACYFNILSLVTSGDASIEAAKLNGGITTVTSVERDIRGWNIYIALGQSCTIVRGY